MPWSRHDHGNRYVCWGVCHESPATSPWQVPIAFCKSQPLVLGLQHANTSSEVMKIYMNLFYGCTIGSSLAQVPCSRLMLEWTEELNAQQRLAAIGDAASAYASHRGRATEASVSRHDLVPGGCTVAKQSILQTVMYICTFRSLADPLVSVFVVLSKLESKTVTKIVQRFVGC